MPFFAAWMSGGICCVEFFAFLRNVDKVSKKHQKQQSQKNSVRVPALPRTRFFSPKVSRNFLKEKGGVLLPILFPKEFVMQKRCLTKIAVKVMPLKRYIEIQKRTEKV